MLSALLDGGVVTPCQLYFGGIVLPYVARDVRLHGINYMTVESVERPDSGGWDSELALLYYRELLHYGTDPFEAAAFEDEHWRKHRVDMTLVHGTEVVKLQAMHMPFLKHSDCQDPVEKLQVCFQTLHMFRIFEISST